MRAFMSTGGRRHYIAEPDESIFPGITPTHTRAEKAALAEREALRILAETEPDGPLTASFGIERIAARNCAPNVWTGALADALRAFVETCDACNGVGYECGIHHTSILDLCPALRCPVCRGAGICGGRLTCTGSICR